MPAPSTAPEPNYKVRNRPRHSRRRWHPLSRPISSSVRGRPRPSLVVLPTAPDWPSMELHTCPKHEVAGARLAAGARGVAGARGIAGAYCIAGAYGVAGGPACLFWGPGRRQGGRTADENDGDERALQARTFPPRGMVEGPRSEHVWHGRSGGQGSRQNHPSEADRSRRDSRDAQPTQTSEKTLRAEEPKKAHTHTDTCYAVSLIRAVGLCGARQPLVSLQKLYLTCC